MGISQKLKQMIVNIWNIAQLHYQRNTNLIAKPVFHPDHFGKST